MGYLRFWRRMKIAPGLTLNLSKSGGSLSFGPRGAKYTVSPRGLSMNDAAKDILTASLRRKKDRSPDLLLTLRYERAVTYEALGQAKRSRTDFERIYTEDPDFENVKERLR